MYYTVCSLKVLLSSMCALQNGDFKCGATARVLTEGNCDSAFFPTGRMQASCAALDPERLLLSSEEIAPLLGGDALV